MAEDKITIYGELKSGVPGGYVTTADQVKGLDAISPMTETTYEELVELCNAGNLVPGMKYVFLYRAMVNASEGLKTDRTDVTLATTGNAMPMIVTALTEETLNDEAVMFAPERQLLYDVRYSLTKANNKSMVYYSWAAKVNQGVIYWMRDINGNEAPYDFVNIYFIVGGEPRYTFTYKDGDSIMEASWCFLFKNNIIKGCYSSPTDETAGKNKLLPYNYFITKGMQSEILNNRIGHRSYDIEINSLCSNNFIGSDCHGITLLVGCRNNVFEGANSALILAEECTGNVWKNGSTASIYYGENQGLLTLENNTFEENSTSRILISNPNDGTVVRNCRIGKNIFKSWRIEAATAESTLEKYFTYNSHGDMDIYIGCSMLPDNTKNVKSILSAIGNLTTWESVSSFLRSYKNVEFFDGIRTAEKSFDATSCILPITGVYFLADKGVFGGLRDNVYYNNWIDIRFPSADFNSNEDSVTPRSDRIFEDITTGIRYVWNRVTSSLEIYR